MSSIPISKKETGTDDVLKILAEQVNRQKIGQVDTKSLIHLYRPLRESLPLADVLTVDPNKATLAESISPSDKNANWSMVSGSFLTDVAVSNYSDSN